jgi:hypothetical protein
MIDLGNILFYDQQIVSYLMCMYMYFQNFLKYSKNGKRTKIFSFLGEKIIYLKLILSDVKMLCQLAS